MVDLSYNHYHCHSYQTYMWREFFFWGGDFEVESDQNRCYDKPGNKSSPLGCYHRWRSCKRPGFCSRELTYGKYPEGSVYTSLFLENLYHIILHCKDFLGLSHVEIDIGASKLVSISPHQLQEWLNQTRLTYNCAHLRSTKEKKEKIIHNICSKKIMPYFF